MQTDLFVSNSSHSLKLMQKYISLYHINSSTLILHGSIAKNQELIDTDLWRNIHALWRERGGSVSAHPPLRSGARR